MEEESPGLAKDTQRVEGLLDQLGARYDQLVLKAEGDEASSSPNSVDDSPPLPGSWLNSLKQSDQNSVSPETSRISSQALQELGKETSHSGISLTQSMAFPQIPGAWATNHISQTGSLSTPPVSSKTKELDADVLLLMPDDSTSDTQAKTDPFSWDGVSTPPLTPIPLTPIPLKLLQKSASNNKRRRFSIAAIICLVVLGAAGASWLLLQQVSQTPDQIAQEMQQRVGASTTPISTPGKQLPPNQTAVSSPHSLTPSSHKATPTPPLAGSTPTVVPTQVPTQATNPSTTQTTFISFEDGGLDGWTHTNGGGTTSIKNLATSSAVDGSHVLMVTYGPDNADNYPAVGTSNLPASLNVGQTIHASVLKTQGSDVEVGIYLIDQTGQWFLPESAYIQVNNSQTWYNVTLTVPSSLKGPITQLGISLYGHDAVIYIDNFSW
ncbi:hypothetical protein [Ktedonospora formicarum]|uniref:Uncharacterized protein n=1 Tax=Ktedonospora formicarum TaxID=2778364 RepID=A0A8J3I228_9CHLR|nr:hypothetical protein [Ktedonospora formicarum]GHO45360.1 hypothetical protein KSX_35230 [Ktedonospora formicarum]